ncbi:methyltransferase domain-containing protein [Flavobacterium psychrophilum]|uniref:Spermidine synthase n=5 Tax=Flavobacterium psychrophilum TaxID=96345 RepID=A6GXW6_FLAPJ|nr:methyltransferase domain-containing protein [Flavobacterium psychrophilum]AIG29670.1 spermidine synthase [Flavobacterium psychrophilum]AIG31947.1 spermidine synthase [Flavobacterium psychrophilum]AIG34102.1 spermidine synthase [Flavobacterium psychrophilum]AIG36465.1 spermidine synthase [Flavobacterium psychrophilum]AIG38730.1 spermidine synthase [Flavobacterium psychrophilum]
MNFKRLLSYLIPIKIEEVKSSINKNLEITWNNGQLVLDSKNTNFSYGSLQKVLHFGLKEVGFERIKSFKNILVLGVAGGSVIKTLIDEIQYEGEITGIEIDPKTIIFANKYFGLDKIKNLQITITDAKKFITGTKETYHLIIIDIFEDDIMPAFLFENEFISNILKILKANSYVVFNTIVNNNADEIRNENFVKLIALKHIKIERIANLEGNNELLILNNLL